MLYGGLKSMSPEAAFEEHIVSLQPNKVAGNCTCDSPKNAPGRDVEAQNEQDFLRKQQQLLNSNQKEAEPVRRRCSSLSWRTER